VQASAIQGGIVAFVCCAATIASVGRLRGNADANPIAQHAEPERRSSPPGIHPGTRSSPIGRRSRWRTESAECLRTRGHERSVSRRSTGSDLAVLNGANSIVRRAAAGAMKAIVETAAAARSRLGRIRESRCRWVGWSGRWELQVPYFESARLARSIPARRRAASRAAGNRGHVHEAVNQLRRAIQHDSGSRCAAPRRTPRPRRAKGQSRR
jgi:hypothetical protein